VPVQKIRFLVELEDPLSTELFRHENSQDVICDFVQGYAFGDTLGIGIRSISGWWTITNANVKNTDVSSIKTYRALTHLVLDIEALSIKLPDTVSLAPSQVRVVPVLLFQTMPLDQPDLQIQFVMTSQDGSSKILIITLPIKHFSHWSSYTCSSMTATYLYSSSTPTFFLVIPPLCESSHEPNPPIIALRLFRSCL